MALVKRLDGSLWWLGADHHLWVVVTEDHHDGPLL